MLLIKTKKVFQQSSSDNQKILSPSKIAHSFLAENNFFNYLQTALYKQKLAQQISLIKQKNFPHQLQLKLIKPESSTLKSPKSSDKFYCLELGGTFLKIFEYKILQNKPKILRQQTIPFYQNIIYTPKVFFAELGKHLKNFIPKPIALELKQLTFILAFPLQPFFPENHQIDGKLLDFNKQHQQRGLIKLSLGQAFQDYLQKTTFPKLKVSLINDSTTNLLAGFAQKTSSQIIINLIVGTGTNLSLLQKNSAKISINNLEFGQYNCFPASNFDLQLRQKFLPAKSYQAEKMFSGAWQNALFQIIYQEILAKKLLKNSKFTPETFKNYSSADLENFFRPELSENSFQILQTIWKQITWRGAFLCAQTTAELIKQIKPKTAQTITIVYQGAILENSQLFKKSYQQILIEQLRKQEIHCHLEFKLIKNIGPWASHVLNQIQN